MNQTMRRDDQVPELSTYASMSAMRNWAWYYWYLHVRPELYSVRSAGGSVYRIYPSDYLRSLSDYYRMSRSGTRQ